METDVIGQTPPRSYTWAFPICPNRVDVDLSVIAALQQEVSSSPEPRQGLLYGRTLPGATGVEGCEAIAGIGQEEFSRAMKRAPRPVVGYYRIREGCAFILTTEEINLAKDFFHKPGAVVLFIERRATGPAEGTFFFWRGEAFVSNLPVPFPIDPALLALEAGPAEPDGMLPDQIAIMDPPSPPSRQVSRIGLMAAVALAGVSLWGALLRKPHNSPEFTEEHVSPPAGSVVASIPAASQGDLEIAWDPQARVIAKGASGALNIDDGGVKLQIPLDLGGLRYGSILYSPATDRVKVTLTVVQPDGSTVETPTSTRPATAPLVLPAPVADTVAPARRETPARAPEVTATATPIPPPKVEPRAPVKRFTFASADRVAPGSPMIPEPPPAQLPAPVSRTLPIPVPAPLPSAPPPATLPSAPPPASTTVALAPHASLPSGRLIWTGTLLRRGIVELEGHSVSIGSLNGALPGVPVSLTALPAEFSNDGLVVYTTDASRNNRVEPPSAGNGWNKISFVWDPERAHQIEVLESPNPSNRFSRLALRNDARRCSMILIDWTAK